MIRTKEREAIMSERFSMLSLIHERKMRIISGVTGLNLLQEGKCDEASEYIESFVTLKDYPLKYLALNPNPCLPPNQTDLETGIRLLDIAKAISAGNLSKENMHKYAHELAGILHEVRTAHR